MALELEFKIISESDRRSFEDSLSIMINKREYVEHGPMTTNSVVVKDANGDDAIVTIYSILLKKSL